MGSAASNKKNAKNKIKSKLDRIFISSKIQDYYTIEQQIGKGQYGKVYQAHLKNEPSIIVAVKQINKEEKRYKKTQYNLIKEIDILKTLDHPNIIKCYDVYNMCQYLNICQEFCCGGDLETKLKENDLTENEICKIIEQVISGLAHCHAKGVVHRDIKPENILFVSNSKKSEIKIIDFGLSAKTYKENSLTDVVGTPFYIAPEVINEDISYGSACDMWSIGVLLYRMLIGSEPFQGSNRKELFQNIQDRILYKRFSSFEFSKYTNQVTDLIDKLLVVNPKKRLSAQQALNHDWFKSQGLKMTSKSSIQSEHCIQINNVQEEQVLDKLNISSQSTQFYSEVMNDDINHLEEKSTCNLKKIIDYRIYN